MPHQRFWGYHKKVPTDVPKDFPQHQCFFVLSDKFGERYEPWQRCISFDGVRYVLILEYNHSVLQCVENIMLEQVYLVCEKPDSKSSREQIDLALDQAMNKFWPYLKKDFQRRQNHGIVMEPVGLIDVDRDDYHSLQLKTVDNVLVSVSGEKTGAAGCHPLNNIYLRLPTVSKHNVHIVDTVTTCVFKVNVDEKEWCLKVGRFPEDLHNSIEKLSAILHVPSVPKISSLLVNGDEKVIGFLSPFIHGVLLDDITSASSMQKNKWKNQLEKTVRSLHEHGIVWGDAKPDNVIVRSTDDKLFLIDFDGGYTDGWVDAPLHDTMEGDLQAVNRMFAFIDNLEQNA